MDSDWIEEVKRKGAANRLRLEIMTRIQAIQGSLWNNYRRNNKFIDLETKLFSAHEKLNEIEQLLLALREMGEDDI